MVRALATTPSRADTSLVQAAHSNKTGAGRTTFCVIFCGISRISHKPRTVDINLETKFTFSVPNPYRPAASLFGLRFNMVRYQAT